MNATKLIYKLFLAASCLCVFSSLTIAQTTTFSYTGAVQTYTVPALATSITIDAYGAGGGGGGDDANFTGVSGGNGSLVQTTYTVTPGEVLTIITGQGGGVGASHVAGTGGGSAGWGNGTYGGAAGGAAGNSGTSGSGGGGGGASAVLLGTTPIVVAGGGGGGGGGGNTSTGTNGGEGGVSANSLNGTNGSGTSDACSGGVEGAAANGNGTAGGYKGNFDGGGGGGGGGGYLGGTGGGYNPTNPDCDCGACGGGGGSNYSPSACSSSITVGGGAAGGGDDVNGTNGYVTITPLFGPPTFTTTVTSVTVCPGESATLSASGATTYEWYTTQTCPPPTSTYSTAGTYSYTVPANITTITVQVWGGGGGGGGNAVGAGSEGGGGGGYSSSTFTVTAGTVYKITVGTGGGGGNSASGTSGGNSWFSLSGSTPTSQATGVLANGGSGGGQTTNGNGGAAGGAGGPVGIGTFTVAGGAGGGAVNLSGGGGGGESGGSTQVGAAGSSGTAVNNSGAGGSGNNANGGNGGAGGTNNGGSNGNGPGGGGGGGGNQANPGGNGAPGQVIVSNSCSTMNVYDTTATMTASPTVTTTYTVQGTYDGCTSVTTGTITVSNVLTPTVTSTTICNGAAGILTASGATTYAWSTGAATNTITASPTSTTTYTVTGSMGTCHGTGTATITISGALTPSVTSTTICNGAAGTLTASGATTYVWSTGAATTTISATPTTNTTYTVTGTTGTCNGIGTGTITVNPIPTLTVTSTTVCNGTPATLTASGATSYAWSTGAATAAMTATPTTTTTYTVTGTSSGCTNIQTSTITVNTSPTLTVIPTTVCNGTAGILTASGATTYQWSNPPGVATATMTATPTITTTYTVTGTTSGCTSTGTGTITVNTIPTLTVTPAPATVCNGTTATLTASGATTYAWSTGVGTAAMTATPTTTTTYSVTGTSAGCSSVGTGTITVNPIPGVTANSVTTCSGLAGTLTAGGATTYLWSTGAATSTVSASPAATTTYTVTGTTNNCSAVATGIINIQTALSVPVVSATICNGQGPAGTLTASNAVTYLWSVGAATTAAITETPTTTTTYSVTGTSGACTGVGTGTITVNPIPTLTVTSATVCNGTTGTLTATGAATYAWNTGAITDPLIASPASTTTYTVTGTTLGCTGTGTGIINVNPLPTATIAGTVTKCLNDPDPTITFTGEGATAPYAFTYSLNGGANQTISSTGANTTITLTAPTNVAGVFTYSLISVQDASSTACSQGQTGSAVVTVNPLGGTIAGTTMVCQNSADPPVAFSGSGGTAPYSFTYSINGGGNQTVSSTGANSTVALAAPTTATGNFVYTLSSVEDATALSCLSVSSVTVAVNALPTASITGTVTKCLNDPDPLITFTGAGTTPPYTFTYSLNGGGNQTISSTGAGSTVTIAVPTNVGGTFTYSLISVQDGTAQNCAQAQTGSAVVTVNPLGGTIAGTTTVCQNAGDPAVIFTGGGGTAPYSFTYNINGGGNQTVSSTGANSTVSVAAPTATTGNFVYALSSVEDATALTCLSVSSVTVAINALPTATISGTAARCINGPSADITFTGGNTTPPYTFAYSINGGANQTVISAAGSNTVTVAAPTTVAGTFTYSLISVQDGTAQNCAQAQTGSAVVTVNPMAANATGTAAVCENAADPNIVFTGSGGTAPYVFTYNINGGGNQTISSTGASSTVSIAVPTTAVGGFTYSITSIEDATPLTCASLSDAMITVNTLPTAGIAGTTTVCQGAPAPTITFTGANTTAPYMFTYSLNGGANQTITTAVGNSVTLTTPTTASGGFTYSLISVQDASSTACSQAQTGSAVVTVSQLPTATIAGTTTLCQNAPSPDITFTGANTTAPYTFTYTFNGGANQTITTAAGSNTVTITPPTATSGTYTYSLISVQDASAQACSQAQTGGVTVVSDHLPTAVSGNSHTLCQSDSTYTLVTGEATQSYGNPFWQVTTPNAGKIKAGGLTLTPTYVIDSVDSMDIVDPIILTMTVTSTNTCAPTTATATYTINIDPLPVAIGGSTEICENTAYTLKNNDVIAGNGTFKWTQNGTGTLTDTSGSNLTPIYASTAGDAGKTVLLTITVTSNYVACASATASAVFSIKVDSLPIATDGLSTTICENSSVTVTGAYSKNGSVVWRENGKGSITTGDSTLTPIYTSAAGDVSNPVTLTMIVSSTNACAPDSATAIFTVNVDPLPTATIAGSTTVCQNAAQPNITFTGANTTAPYTFTYSLNGGGNQTVVTTAGSNSATIAEPTNVPGPYTYSLISVQDASSAACSQPQPDGAVITVNALPTASIVGSVVVCQHDPNPTITFTGAGTTPSYTFAYTVNGVNQTITTPAGSNTATLAVSTANGAAFNYNLLNVKDGSSAACSNVVNLQTANVTVNQLPTATITASATVCQNDPSPIITFTGSNGTPLCTFFYTINSGASLNLQSANGSIGTVNAPTTTAGSYLYQLDSVEYSSNGKTCANTINQTVTIKINPAPTATITGGANVCINNPAPIITFTGAGTAPPYTFSFSVNNSMVNTLQSSATGIANYPSSTGSTGTFIYSLTGVQDANGCSSKGQSGTTTVTVSDNPIAIFTVSPESPTILQPTVTVTNNSTATSWMWNFGDGNVSASQNPGEHTYPDTANTYIIKLIVTNGSCTDSSFQTVIVQMPILLYIPNSFTPNGDGLNDVFIPKGEGVNNYSMYMYDRWGNMIFYSDDISKGWDGRANGGNQIAQEDAYVYVISATDPQGHSYVYRGVVTLIR